MEISLFLTRMVEMIEEYQNALHDNLQVAETKNGSVPKLVTNHRWKCAVEDGVEDFITNLLCEV